MVAIASRSTVLAVVREVTENLLRIPQAATDYVPLQADGSMEPNYDQIENLEIKASIGRTAAIQGGENPVTSLSFYLKGSGTEGVAPQWNELARSFFGEETVEATQRVTAAGSTVSTFNVTGAAAAGIEQGYGVLIKDPVNGYRVRVCDTVTTNSFTPSFTVPVAPGTTVGLGKPVYWTPANDSHSPLSVWRYEGNGGAVQAIAGCKVNDFSFSLAANDAINATAGLEGLSYYFNPIEITSSTRYIDFTDDAGTFAAAVTAQWYRDPHQLAEAITTAMNAAGSAEVHLVEYSDSLGKYVFTCDGSTVLSLLWNTGANTANTIGTKVGFLVAADDTGAGGTVGYTSDSAATLTSPYTPTYDSTQPNVAKNQEIMIGTQTEYVCFEASSVDFSGTDGIRKIESICAESGRSGSIVNSRECEITVVALLNKYDAKMMARFRNGTSIRFQMTVGQKSGGNWTAGTVVYGYGPQCKVTSISLPDDDGLISINLTIQPAVSDTGTPEFYLGQL